MSHFKYIKGANVNKVRKIVESLGKIPDDILEDFTKKVIKHEKFIEAYLNRDAVEEVALEIQKLTKNNKENSELLVEAIGVCARIDTKKKLNDFISDLKIVDIKQPYIEKVVKIVKISRETDVNIKIKETMEISKLSESMLPSLAGGSTVFDVRFEFEHDKIIRKVPVAIIQLAVTNPNKTGETNYYILQSRLDILKIFIKDLQKTYKRLEILEKEVN